MATKRKALGRGLNALLPAVPATTAERSYLEIPLDSISPNKYQPRTQFDPLLLNELAQSIKSNGVVQPIVVRQTGSQYQLITGERRWRAAKLAGLQTIPAVVRDISEYKTLEWALIENIQREDLNPIEEASAYASLIEDFDLTQEEVALRVGKDRSSVANYIRLLKLPKEVREKVQNQQLSMGHARALSALEKANDQIQLANRILQEQLNVRQTEELIRHWKDKGLKQTKKSRSDGHKDPNIRAAELKLQEFLGTRVNISAGKIEIHFQDPDDLIRIYDLLIL